MTAFDECVFAHHNLLCKAPVATCTLQSPPHALMHWAHEPNASSVQLSHKNAAAGINHPTIMHLLR